MTTQTGSAVFHVTRSSDRAFFDEGWLKTFHSFSFARYVDRNNVNWGALRVFNDDTVLGGEGFPPHPHRDMEIVTYVLSGRLAHRDSMGNHGVVEPGGVQFMSAGSGVEHSEFNDDLVAPLHFVQMWVLPGARGTAPSYGQRQFTAADRHNTWLRVASGRSGVEAPIRLTQQATLTVARVENAELNYEFDPARYGFLFVASGAVEANGERLAHGDTVRMYDVRRLTVSGDGELVLWDLPEVSA